MFLIFDTETTGLPGDYKAPISDTENWPRVVQLAWQLHDIEGRLLSSGCFIIKPDGFTIPYNAQKIHGISTEVALSRGLELIVVMEKFLAAVEKSKYLCGHNVNFDLKVLGCEFFRLKWEDFSLGKTILDTMCNETTAYCAIPGGKGGKNKWPQLGELYHKLFSEEFREAHNAAFDVEATAHCLFLLFEKKILKIKELGTEEISKIKYESPPPEELETRIVSKSDNEVQTMPPLIAGNESTLLPINFAYSSLHNHSQFSILQCTTSIADLVLRAIENRCPAVALSDHGNMYGAFLFWQAVANHNKKVKEKSASGERHSLQELKPILGCELNVCKNRKDKSKQDNGYAQVFLAKNMEGYRNLSKMSSAAHVEGFYYLPRIDREFLLEYRRGLIVLSGGLQGEIPQLILNYGEEKAEEAICWWKENFGSDFYLELNRHYLPEEKVVNDVILRMAKKHQIKYVATNNNYYPNKTGADAHDVLLCIKDNEKKSTKIGRGKGFRYGLPNNEFYFKSAEEMSSLFADLPDALETIAEITEKVENFSLAQDILLPKFQIPDAFLDQRDAVPNDEGKGNRGENAYLRHLAYKGAEKRFSEMDEKYRERIEFELTTVERMGFPGYFLIVSDFTSKAGELGVTVGPGRGSAAGSLIAYCLGITNIDPIKFDLLFERFLNPDRISMPDIDIDFDDRGRDKVISYVIEKYGADRVAQIITHNTLKGKSAIRNVARVLDYPLSQADSLAKSYPDFTGSSLKKLLAPGGIDPSFMEGIKDRKELQMQSTQFRKLFDSKGLQRDVLELAYQLEGCLRNTGTHACGIIITPLEMTNYVPVCKGKDNDMLVTQFDNAVAESSGLLKMDFLGLNTLTILNDAALLIGKKTGTKMVMDAIPLNDSKTFSLFQRGETNGLFQFEGPGMQKYLKELKPDKFTDLIAMNALFRPGPMAYIPNYINRKHGREQIVYDLPGMEEFLEETYGITVYQEQVMRLSQKLAGFSKGDADMLRKAMGKKQKEVLSKMKSRFIEGCSKNEYNPKICEKIWTDWEAFASYAFNKSHSTCYALLAYQTGYIKAHYPAEFMSAVLSHSVKDIKELTNFLEECQRMNLKVLGPDVNESEASFVVNQEGAIRFGLAAIKGLGSNVVDILVEERKNSGRFTSIFDLCRRLDTRIVNKKSLEALAQAGAFDSFPKLTRAMFFVEDASGQKFTDTLIRFGNNYHKNQESSQKSLFDEGEAVEQTEPQLPVVKNWEKLFQLGKEKEVIGIYLSGHPLDQFKFTIKSCCKNTLSELADLKSISQKELTLGGIVTAIEMRTTKAGKPYCQFTMEDYSGSFKIFLFGEDFVKFRNYPCIDSCLYIKGKVMPRYNDENNNEFKVAKMDYLANLLENNYKSLVLSVPLSAIDSGFIKELDRLTSGNPGTFSLMIKVGDVETDLSVSLRAIKRKIKPESNMLSSIARLPGVEIQFS